MDFDFFKVEEDPVRLNPKREPIAQWEKILVAIGIITGIILLLILFLVICFILVPPTQGFYWW